MTIAFNPGTPGTYNPVIGAPSRIRLLAPDEWPAEYVARIGPTQWAAADLLGLPEPPSVALFDLCDPDHPDALRGVEFGDGIGGFTFSRRPDTIYVRARMTAARLERAIVHETRHVWQVLHGITDATHGREARELDAHQFDAAWVKGDLR